MFYQCRTCGNNQNINQNDRNLIENISEKTIKHIYDELLNKTIRSMFNIQMKQIREKYTGHYASSSIKEADRETLKHGIGKHKKRRWEKIK